MVTSLAVDDDTGRDVHGAAPLVHVFVGVVADVGVVERSPAAEENATAADFFVAGHGFIDEVEEVVMQGNDLLHELDVLHQADDVVGEELDSGNGADAAGVQSRRMDVASFH